ncbi:hypothetical protein EMIHUDRAFT_226207 [Emiliania huxleyi CCMP1516]|uniref:Uncharacterized protein n=2 Tax=Emiliania huxleyi TaxID=2903 RepID=A0A0D3KLP1_EMIH1|nr:hypothetical protein EMIHUDRAFT_226207 [Emiliania huxleyi CCMP1516]EOD36676.1 hypothetical protein EMIHUDRAFT_226207 [Emiliania huxleyi CCMP1516]|eukprot:XP_005789105.1 hypothetical protein EMIHUDRAFT_226207 [Emiliania huxleyi CCMP1516]
MLAAVGGSAHCLEALDLGGCTVLSADAVATAAEARVRRRERGSADLTRGCDASGVLAHLSLNNVPALGDACLVALKEHCADSLESLDLSWCRAVSDNGVGALVDAAPRLQRLTVWGCSQLTNRFYEGHSREHLRVVGRSI